MDSHDQETFHRVQASFERGRYLAAWEQARGLGPLAGWRGAAARVLAGRLATALGGSRLGRALHLRAGRRHPEDPDAVCHFARAFLVSRGPLSALRLVRRLELPAAPAATRADWLSLRAAILARFGDFEAAESLFAEAEALCPRRAATAVEHAAVLEQQDRFEEALARVMSPLEAGFAQGRAALGSAARLLERLGRVGEALALLERAGAEIESPALAAHRALLLLERERIEEAEAALDRFETLSPLLEVAGRRWLAGRRSDAAYLRGDLARARALAEQAGNGFYREIARRLGEPARGGRTLLAVPFVQQERLTCSPSSIAAVAAYWSRPIDARALAREIADEGTPGHREREWARAHGWAAREFRLTAAACEALIGAGVPFLIGRQGPSSAHAQVVAGLDRRRGTLLVRDPAWPRVTEVLLDRLLEEQAAFGPRCLALLPAELAAELVPEPLPDEPDYDAYHELQLLLLADDRAGALAIREALPCGDAHERVRLLMDVRLADHDGDHERLLRLYEALLARHPATPALLLKRAELLVETGYRSEAVALLEPLVRDTGSDPAFALRLAELRAAEEDQADACIRLLERVLEARPSEAGALGTLARLLWSRGEHEEALELHRLAACNDGPGQLHAAAYLRAARRLGRSRDAAAFLAGVARLRARSGAAVPVALWHLLVEAVRDDAQACEQILGELLVQHPADVWAHRERALLLSREGRHEEALAALAPALVEAPDDPGTLGVHGHVLLAAGRADQASERFRAAVARSVSYASGIDGLLEAASGADASREALRFVAAELVKQPPGDACFAFRRRASAVLSPEETLAHLDAVRSAWPGGWQAWSALADEHADQGRLGEARALLDEAIERFPGTPGLRLDSARLHRRVGDGEAELAALRSAVAAAPASPAALRELAGAESRRGRHAEALKLLRRASALDPDDTGTLVLTAEAQHHAGDGAAAAATLQRALRLDPSDGRAWEALERLGSGVDEFARELARERPHDPAALLAAAWRLPADALGERLALLDRVLTLRPREVHAHDQRVVALCEAGRLQEALADCAPPVFGERPPRELRGRRAWVLWRGGRAREAIEGLRAVLAESPGYWWGAHTLAEWTAEQGNVEEALEAAGQLLRLAPLHPEAHRARARARLLAGDQAGARADLAAAAALDRRDPGVR